MIENDNISIQNMVEYKESTNPKHDCYDFKNTRYTVTEDYTIQKCMICDRIIKFRWKSFLKRILTIL